MVCSGKRRGARAVPVDMLEHNRALIRAANSLGFTVNLSADDLRQADRLAELRIGPVAVVLPKDHGPRASRTPAGRKVVVCPAQVTKGMTCAACELCALSSRKAIVGFLAHGQGAQFVSERARRRLPIVAA